MKIKYYLSIGIITVMFALAIVGAYVDSNTKYEPYVGKVHCHAHN